MKDVIIALDFPTVGEVKQFLNQFDKTRKPYVKIGMELFYAEGPSIIETIKATGSKIFLDLKLHDIPNTVKRTMKVLATLDVDMCNLHAGGGSEMMKAAREGLEAGSIGGKRPLLLAVTMLTSTSEERMQNELLIQGGMEQVVLSYAQNAKNSGLDGVVCSPLEAAAIKNGCGDAFLTVTPGIRFADGDKGDQIRVTTPELAAQLGSDFIVVGRAVTHAPDPVAAYERCVKEFLG